ncbi:MAG: dienelactone hydrolase family protein [Proteobacteria bacterium]|nr:dienelactone hydrolase family protein [Pseudomonadota bacterium]
MRNPSNILSILILALFALTLSLTGPAGADKVDLTNWPAHDTLDSRHGEPVTYPSHSPFTLWEVGKGEALDPPSDARATLFLPENTSPDAPVPAVILLHGAAGVLGSRELTYGAQFAQMGVAALVVDAFGARRDKATGFLQRLLEITETMALADAYSGLRFLDAMPEVDGDRVALMGFSYGGMSTMLGAFAQTAEALNPGGKRFSAHISFYGPCIARFDDTRATGAPVLLLAGSEDGIVDPERCGEIVEDLRAGGADAEFVLYQGAYHQWDGRFAGPRTIGRNLADCDLNVNEKGIVRDTLTLLPMSGPFLRKVILGVCSDSDGYLIGRDDAIRERSNRDVGAFLMRAFNGDR